MVKKDVFVRESFDALTAIAYPGAGSVLLAFDLEGEPAEDFAGFSIKCTPPSGKSYFLPNRLNFNSPVTNKTKPEERVYTPSNKAPFQKFRWVDFPAKYNTGNFIYEIFPAHFVNGSKIELGKSIQLNLKIEPEQYDNFNFGFTRGYLSSQAYADRFHNAPIRPDGKKTIDFDAKKFEAQYEWLGFTARKMILDFLKEAVEDESITVDALVYDIDEPSIVSCLEKLGSRLRIFMDDASLHTAKTALEPKVKKQLQKSAGTENVKTGHFKRFAHNKVFIQKKNGTPIKVLAGSANFSVRGLYVQANNVYTFNDPYVAGLYEKAFETSFENAKKFSSSEIALDYFNITVNGCPQCKVAFSPHKDAEISLKMVGDAIKEADNSVMFAIMGLTGTGPVLERIRGIEKQKVFTYGVTQSTAGLNILLPGSQKGAIVPFSFLNKTVPYPFKQEWGGGQGQVIHHKFVVVDFNNSNPILFTGSSNLAAGGEVSNGDNLIAIMDRGIATAYAVESVRLLDHYHFRSIMKNATESKPLILKKRDSKWKWWKPYFDKTNIKYKDRILFSHPAG